MILQVEITLKSKSRGFHLVTSEIVSQLPKLPKTCIVNIFTKHTSSLQAKRTVNVERCQYYLPITDRRLNLGTWQGIYFCEYRNYGGSRELVGLELCSLAMQERL
jgi:thiamine phosphate synthase YjbQ (UPF0047 family)